MRQRMTLEWLYAATARAVKTIAQTALGMFTVGAALNEIDWRYVMSVAVVAGIYSMLTSIATTLPETITDGELRIEETGPDSDVYRLELDTEPEDLKAKKYLRLKVNNTLPESRE